MKETIKSIEKLLREEGQFEGSPPTKEIFARHEETIKRMKEGLKAEKSAMDAVKDALKCGIKQMKDFNAKMDEKYPMSKQEPKIDMKEESVEPVSIWKDVSELPEYGCRILVKHKHHRQIIPYYYCNGIFTPDNKDFSFEIDNSIIKKFCLLTDFVNQVEDMEARLRKLEGK